MSSVRVFVFAPADETGETHRRLEGAGCRVVLGRAGWHTPHGDNEEEMRALARDADALTGTSIRSSPITRRIMESSDRLRVIAKYTVGVDDVDVDAATELGILVTHAPTEANWGGVAEGAIAMMLTLLKKVRERDEYVKGGGWREEELEGIYLGARADGWPGITVGLVGVGRTGSRMVDLLRPWRVRILAHDPYVPPDRFILLGVPSVDYATLLRESDVVSLHVTLTRETHYMLGAPELALMKPSAILINTSRGAVLDEAALVDALRQNAIAGAALDVFEDEPLPAGSALRKLGHRVLLSPHMVSSNVGSGLRPGIIWATESVLQALGGQVPDSVYNKDVIPRWLTRFGGRSVFTATP
jgi:D-3-phosphoglycerate dehydrogenase / 2-oxoglutarate reductase